MKFRRLMISEQFPRNLQECQKFVKPHTTPTAKDILPACGPGVVLIHPENLPQFAAFLGLPADFEHTKVPAQCLRLTSSEKATVRELLVELPDGELL